MLSEHIAKVQFKARESK